MHLTHPLLISIVATCVAAFSAAAAVPQNLQPTRIGGDQAGGNLFRGEIAALRLYDRALTAAELAGLGKAEPQMSAAPLKPVREWLAGKPGDGAAINGEVARGVFSGGFVELNDSAALKFPDNFSIDAWIRPTANGITARIVDKITVGGTDGFLLDLLNGDLRCIIGGQTVVRAWDTDLNPEAWTHVAAICANNRITLFVNGRSGKPPVTAEVVFTGSPTPPESALTLWWKRPGTAWTDCMVLGNGRLGAMVDGGVRRETMWLNDDTLWSGEPFVPNNPNALAAFPEVRKLLIEGKGPQAQALFNQKMLGPYNQCYMPLGNLTLDFMTADTVTAYRRTLDLRNGVATVEYQQDGIRHTRETFASFPDQAVITRIAADRPGQVSFSASLSGLIRHRIATDGKLLRMTGRCPIHADPHYIGSRVTYDESANPRGMSFAVELQAIPEGGEVSLSRGRLTAKGCDAVTLILVAATSYNGFDTSPSREGRDPLALCKTRREAAVDTAYAKLLDRHTADFSSLMNRVALDLGATAAARRPTDERLRDGFKPEDLAALTALYYQFGRYLLVSASRSGSQASNLQGIWNRSMNPPWSANWTMNCNANFNYLGIEAANLSELHEPFIRLVREWSVDGARTAATWYGLKGWVGHHNCDLWRNACPVGGDALWACFPCGSAWACQDLWEHYAFTLDHDYLRGIWPTLRGSAEFYLDYLFKDPKTGYLVTGPDVNFENGSNRGAVCMGPTPSNMMVRQLFLNCIAATEILSSDAALRIRIEQAMAKLPPTVVSPENGEIQEYLDPEQHISDRRVSELLSHWGLIWCDQVTPRKTPELAAAMRRAYEAPDRRPWLTGEVGSWQGAFPANTFARLGDGERVCDILAKHFEIIVHPNLTAGFIQSEWEIDGNLGNMAAIGEMLLQSHTGEIELLPALPESWPDGKVSGLRARGGFEVDIEWKDGKLTHATVRSVGGTACLVRYRDRLTPLTMQPGQSRTL